MRTRRRPDVLLEPERRPTERPRGPLPAAAAAVLQLQAAAGNRAVVASLADPAVQRLPVYGDASHVDPNPSGVLTLAGEQPIPINSATWYLKARAAVDNVGSARTHTLVPGVKEIGDIVMTRTGDAQSERVAHLLGTNHDKATLRLDRSSPDGALPATTLDLRDVDITSFSRTRDDSRTRNDPPVERLTASVGSLLASGMGREASKDRARWTVAIRSGTTTWPAIPVLSMEQRFETSLGDKETGGQPGTRIGRGSDTSAYLKVKVAAGPSIQRLSDALDRGLRLDIVVTAKNGQSTTMSDALVTKVASSPDGPDVVEVEFAG